MFVESSMSWSSCMVERQQHNIIMKRIIIRGDMFGYIFRNIYNIQHSTNISKFRNEFIKWMDDNIENEWSVVVIGDDPVVAFYFLDKTEAFRFKTMWNINWMVLE